MTEIPKLVSEGVVVDAVCCDPPYHLSPLHQRFNKTLSAAPKHGADGAHYRLAKGFMGQKWDGGDIAFRSETWAMIATIMRPGAFLVAFGGTRTHHRVWCAIEDAGFVIQDTIMWLFGSGFPKRRDMLKPAFEPICLAYKPGGKRTMQIHECRIETSDNMGDPHRFAKLVEHHGWSRPSHTPENIALRGERAMATATALGRWPANICHDGSDEVLASFPNSQSQRSEITSKPGTIYGNGAGLPSHTGIYGFNDSGSAARFFFSAKAGAEDRWGSRHPTVKPVELMKWLVTLVTPLGGLVLDPFAGSGTTGVAVLAASRDAILIEREDAYIADIRERMAHHEGSGRHSLASKARRREQKPLGGLFDGL